MALTKEDVELLRGMMREEIAASETNIRAVMREEIAASETNIRAVMREEIAASETNIRAVMREEIAASENRMMAYMENTIEKKIDLLAEGQMALGERMDRMQAELDDVHSSVLANEIYIIRNAKQQGSV